MAASISATILLCGMLVGVGAKLGPFSKRDRSSGKSGFLDRASKHCLRARINICHDHIKTSKDNIKNTKRELSLLINEDTYSTLMSFLKSRTTSFHNNINTRHAKKFANMNSIGSQKAGIHKNNRVVNLSKKPLLPEERSLFEK